MSGQAAGRSTEFAYGSDPDCGGCQGLGSHRRWCRNSVGLAASVYGPMSERLESMGDTVGPNNMELSNRLWALSGDMREWAKSLVTPPAATTPTDAEGA